MSSTTSQGLSLKIFVEKEKNQFLFAELSDDLADVMFSVMAIPIGTIIELSRECSATMEIGCLNNLYQSIENLDEKHINSVNKKLLLHPRSAVDLYCLDLKLNLTGRSVCKYFVCSGCYHGGKCRFLSYYHSDVCHCKEYPARFVVTLASRKVPPYRVFVKPNTCFIVTDDFEVCAMTTSSLVNKFGAMINGNNIEERTLNIGTTEVLKLLVASLSSKTPFSDTLMEAKVSSRTSVTNPCSKNVGGFRCQSGRVTDTSMDLNINLKLIIDKRNKRALFAEVGNSFVDLLFSFLAIPIGHVFKELASLSTDEYLGNLYKSIEGFDVNNIFISEEMKSCLVNPKLPPGLAYGNTLIEIEEAKTPSLSTLASMYGFNWSVADKNNDDYYIGGAKVGGGCMKGSSLFLVTDDLSVSPLTPSSVLSQINRSNASVSDLEELKVTVGKHEALHLLAASLVSKSALTDVFLNEIKKEP